MSQSTGSHEPEPVTVPTLWEAILEIVRGLKDQPILLFGFGIAVIIFAAGTLGVEKLRIVAGTLLVLAILVMAVWIALKASNLKASRAAAVARAAGQNPGIHGGNIIIDKNVRMVDNKINQGNVTTMDTMRGSITGGDLHIGSGTDFEGNQINSGNVKIGDQPESKKE